MQSLLSLSRLFDIIILFFFLLETTGFILKPMWGEVRLKMPTVCSFHVLPFNKTIAERYTMERLCPRQKKQVRKAWLEFTETQRKFS